MVESTTQEMGDLLALRGVVGASLRPKEGLGRIIVVLPAFNEEQNLGPLLEKIDHQLREASLPFQIIIVDDGSTDQTPRIIQLFGERIPISPIRHRVNLGLGQTIADGLRAASDIAGDDDVVISMDADETHSSGLIPRMFRAIREGHDVVIASRYRQGSRVCGLSAKRRFASLVASWITRIVFPTPGVRDFTCGYRAYSGKALRLAFHEYGASLVDQSGFQCMMDILLKMRRLPLVFGEVPMVLRYDFKKGPSKLPLVATIKSTLLLLLKRRLGRFGNTQATVPKSLAQ
jgi:dolichol-phosphate mannosyltransferase